MPRPINEILREAEDRVHVRRFDEADAGVAEVLAREPNNAQAHYVAGLSRLFAKRVAEARAHFARALELEPANAQFHFVTAMALADLGNLEDSSAAYARAIQLRPNFFEALANRGNVLQRLKRRAEAIEAYRRALALRADDANVLTALGICEFGEGQVNAAITALQRSVELRPDSSAAFNALGNAVARTGDLKRAIEYLRRATQLRPDSVEAWASLGEQLHAAREDHAAIEAFDRALALEPGNEETRFRRDAAAGARVDRAPDGFVKNVFDRYAADFDRRLIQDLEYRAPQDLAAFLGSWLGVREALRIVDLGCGTGLSGAVVRAHASHLAGVDLSAKMLEQAKARGIYDELAESDVVAFLDRAAPGAYDLALALEVLVYIGNVAALFSASARALGPGGVLAFSTEDLPDEDADFCLARTGRYGHSRRYVVAAATAAGLLPMAEQPVVLRKENGQPVPGRLYAFVKSGL